VGSQARAQGGGAGKGVTTIPITPEIIAGAAQLLARKGLHRFTRQALTAIASGKRTAINPFQWRTLWSKGNEPLVAKLEALADLKRNPNAHERAVAARKLKAARERAAPGLEAFERDLAAESEARRRRMDEVIRRGAHAAPSTKPGATDSVSEDRARARANAARRTMMDEVARRATAAQRAYEPRPNPRPTHAPNSATDSVSPGGVKPKPNSSAGGAGRAAGPKPKPNSAKGTDSVSEGWLARRTAARAAHRAGLRCVACVEPLKAQRPTARYCGGKCRLNAWKARKANGSGK
jgi:hypothetical protein